MKSKAKSVALVAGFGSGKTEFDLFKVFSVMFSLPEANLLYLAPTFSLIADIWYVKVEEFLERLNVGYWIDRSRHVIHVAGAGKIFCRSMEHPGRIVGFEVLHAFLDELDILPTAKAIEVWRKAKARCRQKVKDDEGNLVPSQMFVSTTPEGFKATHKLFVKEPLPNSELIQMSTYSNQENLPPDYIDELRANYPPQLIDAYIEGRFVNLTEGRVWYEYARDLHASKEVVTKKDTQLIVGMDFNVNRGAAVVYVKRGRAYHAVDEIHHSRDTGDTIAILKERYSRKMITVYPDASGKSRKSVDATISDIALLKEAGFRVKANKKNPNIKDRVAAFNAMLVNGCGERRLFVNEDKCPFLADALEQHVYDKNGLPEKTGDEDDLSDITDAASYPIATLHPIKKLTATRVALADLEFA